MTFRGNLPISWFVDRLVCDILTTGPSYIVKRGRYPLGKKYKQMSSTQTFLKELKRLLLKCMRMTSCIAAAFKREDILEPMSLLLNYFFRFKWIQFNHLIQEVEKYNYSKGREFGKQTAKGVWMEFFIFNLLFKYIEMPLKFLIQDKDNKGPLVCLLISALKDILECSCFRGWLCLRKIRIFDRDWNL